MQRGSEKRRGQRGSAPVCECRPDALTRWVHACCNVLHPWTATDVFAKLCANHERTLSPLQAPNSLDAQAPSPSEELSLEDLAGLEEVELDRDLIDALDDPTDMFICRFPMNTSLGQGTTMDHTIPITSNYLYIPGVVPVRPLEGQSPVCYAHRTYIAAVCSFATLKQNNLSFGAEGASTALSTSSNMYSHVGGVGGSGNVLPSRKDYQIYDYLMRLQQLHHLPHQLVFPGDEMPRIYT